MCERNCNVMVCWAERESNCCEESKIDADTLYWNSAPPVLGVECRKVDQLVGNAAVRDGQSYRERSEYTI